MSRPDKGVAHKLRWPLIQQLLSLGLSAGEITELTNVDTATIRLDIRQHGNVTKLFPDRPKRHQRYQTIFKRFAQLMIKQDSDQNKECQALWQWLKIDELQQLYVLGLIRMAETLSLPRVLPEQEPYLRLMIRIHQIDIKDIDGTRSDTKAGHILNTLCSEVNQGLQVPPNSQKEFQVLLLEYAQRYLDVERRLCLAWSKNAHTLIDKALDNLSPQQARVLRFRFGIGYDRPLSFEQISQPLELTEDRIRQIEAKAIRRMRHWAKKEPMCFLLQAPNFKYLLDLERHIRIIGQREGELLSEIEQLKKALAAASEETPKPPLVSEDTLSALANILTTPLDEFEFSVRAANCLHNRDLHYLFELVLHNESELLKTKNFGHVSLNEVKNILANFSEKKGFQIKLGMELPPELVDGLQMWKVLQASMRREKSCWHTSAPETGDLSKQLDSRLRSVGLVHWHQLLLVTRTELFNKIPNFTDQNLEEIDMALEARRNRGGLYFDRHHLSDMPPDVPVPPLSIEMGIPTWIQNLL